MNFSFLSEVGVVLIIQIPVPYSYTKVAGPQQLQNIFRLKSYSLHKKQIHSAQNVLYSVERLHVVAA
jgi:hypothetical protein